MAILIGITYACGISVPSGFPPPSTQPKSNGYDSHRSRSCSSLKPDTNRPCSVAHPRGIFTLRKCKSELLSQARHKRVTNSIKRSLVFGDPAKLDHRYIVADLGSQSTWSINLLRVRLDQIFIARKAGHRYILGSHPLPSTAAHWSYHIRPIPRQQY